MDATDNTVDLAAATDGSFPGYEVVRPLARGSMGAVFVARQVSLDRLVALKVFSADYDPEFAQRFVNEARGIAELTHSSVVPIYDVGVIGRRPYFTMEYLTGGDLTRHIRRGLPPLRAVRVIVRLARCLDFVHKRGVVHRDIKPANILFRRDRTPVLTDFGVARWQSGAPELTIAGSVLGSPHYLSPEQARGDTEIRGAADFYSMGCVFYEMLTGERPFTGANMAAVMRAHIEAPIPRLPEPVAMWQPAIDLLLVKEPADRLANGAQLVALLRNIYESIESEVDDEVADPTEPVSPADAAAAEALAKTIIMRPTADPLPLHPPTPKRPSRFPPWLEGVAVLAVFLGFAVALALWLPGGKHRDAATETPAVVPAPSAAPSAARGEPVADPVPLAVTETPVEPQPDAQAAPEPTPMVEPDVLAREPAALALSSPGLGGGDGAPPAPVAAEPVAESESAPASLDAIPAEQGPAAAVAPEPATAALEPAAPAPPAPSRADLVQQWLAAGRAALAEYRLTTPPGDNAEAYFSQVLEIEPGNAEALDGRERIVRRYGLLARRAVGDRQFDRARVYIDRGAQITPGHPDLVRAEQALAQALAPPRVEAKSERPAARTPSAARVAAPPPSRSEPDEPEPPAGFWDGFRRWVSQPPGKVFER